MALSQLTASLVALRGRVGDLVFKRYRGRVVVSRVPRFKSWSRKQKQGRSRFAEASAWAMRVQRDPTLRESYAAWAEKSDLTIRSVAMSDYLGPAGLEEIHTRFYKGVPGGSISIWGVRKFQIVAVSVAIRDGAGNILEEGPARQTASASWDYTATRDVRACGKVWIEASGVDRLGRNFSLPLFPAAT